MDYEIFRLIWWGLLGVLLTGFAVLDGFDFGSATLMPFLGKTDEERRVIINTVGPFWEGNQVWLILGGGAIFAAWPAIYAVAFSGFYLAMFLVLCALILRPVSFKYRSKLPSEKWRRNWDYGLLMSGAVPPVIFGVAVGNALLGVPFEFDQTLRMNYTGTLFGLLNPFALLVGLVSLAMILTQGATWLVVKTEGEIAARAERAALRFSLLTSVLFILAGIWVKLGGLGYHITSHIDPNGPSNPLLKTAEASSGAWLSNFTAIPALWSVPAAVLLGTVIVQVMIRAKKPLLGFIGSSLSIIGIVATAGISMFPFLLPSSLNPNMSLTVWDASSSRTTLVIMTIASLIFVPIVLGYTAWVYKILSGKVTKAYIKEQNDSVY
ncbi:MAG: cytochrome d ubiquinol oxidase subunit II [Alphaproteobacteria bacterium]|nr:cytochrome d ubiquinol oxidase subunit II [Alphaproteobacteria bacterium]